MSNTITTTLTNGIEKTYNFKPETVSGYTFRKLSLHLENVGKAEEKPTTTNTQNGEVTESMMKIGLGLVKEQKQAKFDVINDLVKLSWFISQEELEMLTTKDYNTVFDTTEKHFFI